MKKSNQFFLIELACAVIILALLAERMLPKFIGAQRNINTAYHIPDDNFRKAMAEYMGVGENGYYTREEASERSKSIMIVHVALKDIYSLKGIDYFDHIRELHCYKNNLKYLDISALSALTELNASNNKIEKIILPRSTNLVQLNLTDNRISILNISGYTKLQILAASNNQLLVVDTSRLDRLANLSLGNNYIKTINVSKARQLKVLTAPDNLLHEVDLSKNPALSMLVLSQNKISILDLSANTQLVHVKVSDNPIEKMILPPQPRFQSLSMRNVKTKLSDFGFNQLSTINLINYSDNSIDHNEIQFLKRLEEKIGKAESPNLLKSSGLLYTATMVIDSKPHLN